VKQTKDDVMIGDEVVSVSVKVGGEFMADGVYGMVLGHPNVGELADGNTHFTTYI